MALRTLRALSIRERSITKVYFTSFDGVVLNALEKANPSGMATGWDSADSLAKPPPNVASFGSRRAQLQALFETIDTNNDGVLSLEEMKAHASELSLTPVEATKLFRQLDTDGDGTLSLSEFHEIDATDLSSFEGLTAFFKVNNPFSTSPPPSSSGPLGRWAVGVDKTEVGGKTYDHSA